MMQVEIMRKVWTLYYNGKPTVGNWLLENWNYEEKTIKLFHSSSNFIYEFNEGNQQRILRVTPECRRNEQQILAELDFMSFLRDNGLPIVKNIKSNNDKQVETYDTEIGKFYGVVFERAPGNFIEIIKNRDEKKIFLWGKLLAKIHQKSLVYNPKLDVKRWSWKDEFNDAYNFLGKDDWPLKDILKEKEKWIETLPKENMYGLIHYDLTEDNIIWNGNSYILIDFDDVAYFPFIADIAFAIDNITKEEPKLALQMLSWFIKGYEQIKSLPRNWKEQIEIFFIIEKILKYVKTKWAYVGSRPELDPEWLKKMRERHFNSLNQTKQELTLYWNKK